MQARRFAIVAAFTSLLAISACTVAPKASVNPISAGISLFGTDGNMLDSFGAMVKTPGEIAGMAGTAPLTPLSPAFTNRLLTIDPTMADFNYAGEAYDAVMITSLAAQIAGTTIPKTVARYVDGVTTLDKGGVECTLITDCLSAVAAGKDIAYRGISVHSGFTSVGEPSSASYGTEHFNGSNQIDAQKTEFVSAGDPGTATTAKPPAPATSTSLYTGPALKFGLLLPRTGGLGTAGKPIFAGAELAIKDINAAGGILGQPVAVVTGDDGTDVTKSVNGAKKMIGEGVDAIIGPSTSGAALAVIPLAVSSGVIEFSPSATSAALTTVDDHGMFFRTSPSDILQAQAIADVIMRSGAQRVFIVARDDAYGTGLEHNVTKALLAAGIPTSSLQSAEYPIDPKADNTNAYATIAASIASFHADSVLLVGYEESADVVAAMVAANLKLKAN